MTFEPNKITKVHVLNAIKKVEDLQLKLVPSTGYNLVINDKFYPPKEIMRLAHKEMNGALIWGKTGGAPTNDYLEALGFEVVTKVPGTDKEELSGEMWKLGCNWGSGKPSFYPLLAREEIVVGDTDKTYGVNDLILIAEGHDIRAIAKILEQPQLVTTNVSLEEPLAQYEINFNAEVIYAKVEWYSLSEKDQFKYKLQLGIHKVSKEAIRKKALRLWEKRKDKHWIFQGNLTRYDIETALKEDLLEGWTVAAHKDKIKEGHKAIIWMTGKESACYALAEITHAPREVGKMRDDHLWTGDSVGRLCAGLKITHNLINNPISSKTIKSIPALQKLKVGYQGTNFSATPAEYQALLDLIEGKTSHSYTSTQSENETMESKNIILYGPPGTGKTYGSVDIAVKIATGSSASHAENKKVYDRLQEEGQIEFVTFHQNYAYEDFMVGISPDVTAGALRFEKKEGIFKRMADRAKQNWLAATQKVDLSHDFENIFNKFFNDLTTGVVDKVEIQMRTKSYKFKITKIDVDGGQIKFTKQSGGTSDDLLIRNVKAMYEGTSDYNQEGLGVYYHPLVQALKDFAVSFSKKTGAVQLKKYVLVIDEINRANISRVFGELITLLEEDKRLGEPNEVKVTLPNDPNKFGLPPNLYLIGTMNTADKSIALVDLALRRRFEFRGFYPKYEGYDEQAIILLRTINAAIYKRKKSADYLIGHAYFMKNQAIKVILENKVIPLLMEYFSGKIDVVKGIFEYTGWNVSYNLESYSWEVSKA